MSWLPLPTPAPTGDVWGAQLNAALAELRERTSASREVRSATAAPYTYMGTAPAGTAEADPGWHVTRIDLDSLTTATATGSWAGRESLDY